MQNVQMTVKGSILTIVIDLAKKGKPSSTGKSMLIASTGGNVPVDGASGARIGVNCYQPVQGS